MTVTMELHPAFFGAVRSGKKRSTIRRGVRHFKVGDWVRFISSGDLSLQESAVARVVGVEQKRVRQLTAADAIADGFSTLDELLGALVTFYQDLDPSEIVTIVSFEYADRSGSGESGQRSGGAH